MDDTEAGDEYLRQLSTYIRNHEKSLAESGITRRRPQRAAAPEPAGSVLNPLTWFGPGTQAPGPTPKPLILALDPHHLFYVLMRLEALGIEIGTLDVRVDSPSRPMSYVNLFPDSDKSETRSLASFRSSFSAISNLSLGGSWWTRTEPPSVDAELKYIYSSFTKLPALCINPPGKKLIAELAKEPPNENAIPLDAFKNLQILECLDIDPRALLGWDRLAESLRSLKIKRSGVEDVSDIFIGAVVDDQARREGSTSRNRRRKIPAGPSRQVSFYTTALPQTVTEQEDEEETSPSPQPPPQLSSLKWAFLKHLSLSDNGITFFPSESIPYLTSLTHLDLSSNLLVSVPPGLSELFNLVSLNVSDNMIDSVLGIYQNLGQVLMLNVSHNRLESICGLERLVALERVDLRFNILEESAEVGRLATLPNITEIWVEGNPFVEYEENYRTTCFDYFWKEGKSVTLDGTPPGFYEKRNLTVPPPEQMSSSRPVSTAYSPPVVAVGHAHSHLQPVVPVVESTLSLPDAPPLGVGVGGKARRKKAKRIVQLDGDQSDGSVHERSLHVRVRSDGSTRPRTKIKKKDEPVAAKPSWGQFGALANEQVSNNNNIVPAPTDLAPPITLVKPTPPDLNTYSHPAPGRRHSRYQTEFSPSPSSQQVSPPLPPSVTSSNSPITPSSSRQSMRGSATFSAKSSARRARVSASVYESPTLDNGDQVAEIRDNADAYRKRIEALRSDMGDGWLKVFSQSQMAASPSVASTS